MSQAKMSDQDIINKILTIPTEDETTEFKRVGSDLKVERVAESVGAMANTDGGILILGVDDPQKTKLKGLERVYGIDENLEKYDEIGKNISRISPPLSVVWPPPFLP